jgi:K+-transporting ATPase ATPase C chain
MKTHILISLRMTVILVVVTCGIYPLAVFAIAQTAFQDKANGSFLQFRGRVVGSELIGQTFASDRFFHSRPSAAGNDGYDATSSGGTNLGPTSKKLFDAIAARVRSFDVHSNVPADAVTSSASGLDPHISPQNAYAQAPRVARANAMSKTAVEAMIRARTEGRLLGLYGEPRVNVLMLNIDLLRRRSHSDGR